MNTCYMCDRVAVSSEHVPPKCLFPETKDLQDSSYRKNLITVPSCDIHNSAKSKDDEFLMVSLAGIIGNNSIGYMHKFTKVNRAIKRSANRLLDAAFVKRQHFYIKKDNEFLEIIWGTPDHVRLKECFTHIAYGLHLHHLHTRFEGEVNILLGYLHSEDLSNNNFVQFIRDGTAIELADIPKSGDNPEVFYYQFTRPDAHGLYMVHMHFYNGIDVYASFLPKGKDRPFHLGIELMCAGVETTFTLGEKEYRVNEKKKNN